MLFRNPFSHIEIHPTPHAWVIHALNLSISRASRYMRSLIVSCRLIMPDAGVWHNSSSRDFMSSSHRYFHMTYSSLVFSCAACSIKSCSILSLALTNDAMCLNFLILYYLLGYVTFVSHYIDDDVTARTCCDMLYHIECSWKIESHVHYLATLHLYQIALMMSPQNMS